MNKRKQKTCYKSSGLRPDQVPPDVVPAKTEVVVVVGIDAQPQQLTFNAWTSETALRILVITIGKIPKNVVAIMIYKRQHFRRSTWENPFTKEFVAA